MLLGGLRSCNHSTENMLALREMPLQQFISELRFRHQRLWRDVNNQDPRLHVKKAATYQNWFSIPFDTGISYDPVLFNTGSFVPLPDYLKKDLPRQVLRNVSRFRLRAHNFKVETGCWQEHTSLLCDKCGCKDVQDETHVLFYCRCEHMCELRDNFADLFESLFLPLQTFKRSPGMAPFLSNFHYVTNRDLTDFLGQNNV